MASELVIAKLPGRTGTFLCVQEGNAVRPIARFTKGEESAKEFVDWCIMAGIKYEDTRKGSMVGDHDKNEDGDNDGSSGTTNPQDEE